MSLEFDVLEKNVLTFCTCCRRFCLKIIFEILDRRHRAYTCSLMQRCLGLREKINVGIRKYKESNRSKSIRVTLVMSNEAK